MLVYHFKLSYLHHTSVSCLYFEFQIRNGGFTTSPVLGSGKYCGSSLPSLPETSSNQVYIQLMYKPASGRSPVSSRHALINCFIVTLLRHLRKIYTHFLNKKTFVYDIDCI